MEQLIAWPVTGLILGLAVLALFRAEIKSLIARITSVDKTGLKAANPDAQLGEAKNADSAGELIRKVTQSPMLNDLEQSILDDLKRQNLGEAGSIKVLVTHLAIAQVRAEFEQVHALIFGSQLRLLKTLNKLTGQGLAQGAIKDYFENVKAAHPEFARWEVHHYLEFLQGRLLVVVQGENLHLTERAKEFLVWMARTGRSEDKEL